MCSWKTNKTEERKDKIVDKSLRCAEIETIRPQERFVSLLIHCFTDATWQKHVRTNGVSRGAFLKNRTGASHWRPGGGRGRGLCGAPPKQVECVRRHELRAVQEKVEKRKKKKKLNGPTNSKLKLTTETRQGRQVGRGHRLFVHFKYLLTGDEPTAEDVVWKQAANFFFFNFCQFSPWWSLLF